MENQGDERITIMERQFNVMTATLQAIMERVNQIAPIPVASQPEVPGGQDDGGMIHSNGGGEVGENNLPRDDNTAAEGEHSRTIPHQTWGSGRTEEDVEQRLRAMQAQIDGAMAAVKTPNAWDDVTDRTGTPFTSEVMKYPLPPRFKMPTIEPYTGSGDPVDHLDVYNSAMHLHAVPDEVKCRAFSITLKGPARAWFNRIKPGSVGDFKQLSRQFISHFIGGQRQRKPPSHLLTVRQERDESLRDYVNKFNKEMLEIEDTDEKVALTAFMSGLKPHRFAFSLAKKPPTTMAELMSRAQKHMNGEDAMKARKDAEPRAHQPEKRRQDCPSENRVIKLPRTSERRDRVGDRRGRFSTEFTPLNSRMEQVLYAIRGDPEFKWPREMRAPIGSRDKTKYCQYHRDHGHNTEECIDLRRLVEDLIRKGKYRGFVAEQKNESAGRRGSPRRTPPRRSPERRQNNPQPLGEIRVISGGFAGGGESSSARKRHLKEGRNLEVAVAEHAEKKTRTDASEPITFSEEEASELSHPHDDPLVITAVVANYQTYRILIDGGSSADVLYWRAFEKMNIGKEKLHPVHSPLIGFAGDRVVPIGSVTLPVTLGAEPRAMTRMVSFLVVDCPSAYNAILGRVSMNQFRAVASTYHLMLKFPTEKGIGIVRGSQRAARECYVSSLRGGPQEALVVEELEVRDEEEVRRGEPGDELEEVAIGERELGHTVKIGTSATASQKEELKKFLADNSDVFAWSHEDMPGIDPAVMAHCLNIVPGARPVKQKRRIFAPERNEAVAEEVEKLFRAQFIKEAHYPSWLSNVVMVKKSNGKWRMCVDFSDLNRSCPKDSFPLPSIDQLVNSTAGYEILSFMDAFSGYNQIRMAEHDQEHTAFITDRGLYCYKVMPFGLKNAGATYQRLVNLMFKSQIGRNVEVYVDDMLVKSKRSNNHITDLRETFDTLRQYRMKLNPAKCAFGVASGKFLGFMVSARGIEANPEKVRAIMEMQPPRTTKEVQSLAGRVAALNRFISKSSDKCLPFFKILRKAFEWNEECEEAFKQLKAYLGAVPLLSRTMPGEELYIYLAVSETAVSSALVKEEGGVQKPVYYTSRALRGAEERYPKMELLALALITAARRLRPYFQAHTIVVLTDQPLRNVLHKPETSGRLVKWSIELSQFDIQYRPRQSIKGQAAADFLAEFTPYEELPTQPSEEVWVVSVDGSSTREASGAGVVLITPEGHKIEYALRFNFTASNNEAEYEALIAGLQLARRMGAEQLVVRSDSQLVIEQMNGEYGAKGENMKEYCRVAGDLARRFHKVIFERIPRQDNEDADRLARTASSSQQSSDVPIEILDSPSINSTEVQQIEVEAAWARPIKDYLERGVLPEEQNERRRIQYRSARYLIIEGILYRRGATRPLLRCVNETEADYILREIHEGVCGNHSGWKALAKKVLRSAYYWPTIEKDAQALVRKCDKCQRYATVSRLPARELTPIQSPWPFAQWGIDIIGPLPMGRGQRKFAVVAIDYFTKWAEAEALPSITEQNMKKFLWQGIVCRFGIPRVVITDNGKQFEGRQFNDLCEQLGISHHYSSPEHPQANGQVEVTNRSILKIIKTRLEKSKGLWAEELPSILWAYRTTERTPTGCSPFSLAFGTEAVIPVEVGLPPLRTAHYERDSNQESLKVDLDLLEERRLQAAFRTETYQQRTKQYHKKKVKARNLTVGDLVLKRVNQSTKDVTDGKLGPNWEGPYIVASSTREGTYWLKDQNGKTLPHPWHIEHLKFYYV